MKLKLTIIIPSLIIVSLLTGFLGQKYYLEANQHQTLKNVLIIKHQSQKRPTVPWEIIHHKYVLQPVFKHHVIYYQFDQHLYSGYQKAWLNAMHNWNRLNVIKFKHLPKHYHGYRIHLGGTYNQKLGQKFLVQHNHQQVAVANTQYDTGTSFLDNQHDIFMTNCQCDLSVKLSTQSLKKQTLCATHELGHLLGFNHDNKIINHQPLIMNAMLHDNAKPLGKLEQHALKAMYN